MSEVTDLIPESLRANIIERMARLRAEEATARAIIEQVRLLPADKQEEIAERILEGLPEGAE
jgi:hypothetical protein